jgi:hypothetical protein
MTLAAGAARPGAVGETDGAKDVAAPGLAATDPALAAIAGTETTCRATPPCIDVGACIPDVAGGTRTAFTDADGTLVVTARDVA